MAACNWAGINATVLRYPIAPHTGSASLRVIANGTSTIVQGSSDCFPVTAGTTYNLRAWYHASPPVTIGFVGYGATFFSGAGCIGSSTSPVGASVSPPTITGTWHPISGQQTAPNGAPFVALSARLQLNFTCVLATCETSAGSNLMNAVQWDDIVFGVTLDIDRNGSYDALTDGLLVLRYLFGLTGASLTSGAIGASAARTTPTDVMSYLTGAGTVLDVDGNSHNDALTDGLLILRYLFGLQGSSLTAGAIGSGAMRNGPQIEAYIQSLMA